jgi:Cu+-exporting ATPase
MKVTDPVCGMTIKSTEAAAEIKHEGKTYFFCSTHCRDEFKQAPQRYTHGKAKPQECCGGDH